MREEPDQDVCHPHCTPGTSSQGASTKPHSVGCTTVTINGSDLATASTVDFGSTANTIVSDTPSQIVATAPAGSAGTIDVYMPG
jgi:spore coat protein U-like protein